MEKENRVHTTFYNQRVKGFSFQYIELNKVKTVGCFPSEKAAETAATKYFSEYPVYQIPERKEYVPMTEANSYRFFVETDPSNKQKPQQTLYDMIVSVANRVAKESKFVENDSSFNVEDIIHELVMFTLTRDSITINHRNSFTILMKVAKTSLSNEKKEIGFGLVGYDDATNVSEFSDELLWSRDRLRKALLDWDNLPQEVTDILSNRRFPKQYVELLERRFKHNNKGVPGSDRVRTTNAFNRLQEYLNLSVTKDD